VLQRRQVDEPGREGDLAGDPPKEQPVAEEPDRAQRGVLGAGGERGSDLAGDDPGEGHRRRLQVRAVESAAGGDCVAGMPAGPCEHEEEATQNEHCLDTAEEDPAPEEE